MSEIKLDKIIEDLVEVRITQARHTEWHEQNTRDLAHHIERTDLLQEKIGQIEKDLNVALLPIKFGKAILAISAFVGTLLGIAKYITWRP